MKAGAYNVNDYLDKLYEAAEGNTQKGYIFSDTAGLPLPEDTKKNFDWLNKEYQKGKVEVKVEVKGEGSSFKPGYDLQTDLKSVKDFKPGMYGDIKTGDTGKKPDITKKGEEPNSPKKKGEISAEKKDPKGGKEASNDKKGEKVNTQKQSLKIDTTKNKKDGK